VKTAAEWKMEILKAVFAFQSNSITFDMQLEDIVERIQTLERNERQNEADFLRFAETQMTTLELGFTGVELPRNSNVRQFMVKAADCGIAFKCLEESGFMASIHRKYGTPDQKGDYPFVVFRAFVAP
jgi:hypothetical protein